MDSESRMSLVSLSNTASDGGGISCFISARAAAEISSMRPACRTRGKHLAAVADPGHEIAQDRVDEAAPLEGIEPARPVEGDLFRRLDLEHVPQEVGERASGQELEPRGGHDGFVSGQRVDLLPERADVDDPVEFRERNAGPGGRGNEPRGEVGEVGRDRARAVGHGILSGQTLQPPVDLVEGPVDAAGEEPGRVGDIPFQGRVIEPGLAALQPEGLQDDRGGEGFPSLDDVERRVAEDDPAAHGRQGRSQAEKTREEIVGGGRQGVGERRPFVVEQDGVLEAAARECRFVETDDEGDRPSGMPPGRKAGDVEVPRERRRGADTERRARRPEQIQGFLQGQGRTTCSLPDFGQAAEQDLAGFTVEIRIGPAATPQEPGEGFAERPEIVRVLPVWLRESGQEPPHAGGEIVDLGDRGRKRIPADLIDLRPVLPRSLFHPGQVCGFGLAQGAKPGQITVPLPADHRPAEVAAGRPGRKRRTGRPGREGQVPILEEATEVGAREVVPQPVEETEEEPAGRREGNGDAVPEGHREARPGREQVEDGGVGRPRGNQDLRLIERDFFRVEPAQNLAAFVGRPERPKDLDAAVLSDAGNFPGGEQPGQPFGLRNFALAG